MWASGFLVVRDWRGLKRQGSWGKGALAAAAATIYIIPPVYVGHVTLGTRGGGADNVQHRAHQRRQYCWMSHRAVPSESSTILAHCSDQLTRKSVRVSKNLEFLFTMKVQSIDLHLIPLYLTLCPNTCLHYQRLSHLSQRYTSYLSNS